MDTVDDVSVSVEKIPIGTWRFDAITSHISSREDIEEFLAQLEAYEDKPRTVIKYALEGSAALSDHNYLATELERLEPQFCSLYVRDRLHDLGVDPSEEDLENMELAGFARAAFDELREGAVGGDAVDAQALTILYRLLLKKGS